MKKLLMASLMVSVTSIAYGSELNGTPYIGGSLGYGLVFVTDEGGIDYGDTSHSASAYNLGLFGGWRWQKNNNMFAGLEAKGSFSAYSPTPQVATHYYVDGVYQYTTVEGGTEKVDIKKLSLGLSAHGGKWVRSNLSLYGILGLNHNILSVEGAEKDYSYQSIEFGIGSDWQLKGNWSLRTQVTYDYGINPFYEDFDEKWMQNGINLDIGLKYSF